MIEISHQQAERLISQQFDQRLPDDEWNALQSHLEHCPNCQNYQFQFERMERRLHKTLQARWDPVIGPPTYLPKQVSKLHTERDNQRTLLTTLTFGGTALLILLLFAMVQGRNNETETMIPKTGEIEALPARKATPPPVATAIPLIKAGQFPHVVAYESNIEGDAEIYLINPGFMPENLTQHPAEDTFPTWSPDGEWLALLSNRATQDQDDNKNELYVMSIAGNQLVQLTSETLVDWEGPLSWSGDGKWIALVGVLQDESRQRSIYVVGVDGFGSRRLLNTQGGDSPKFAPYGDRLAFHQTEGSLNRIVIYHTDSGRIAFENILRSSYNPSATDVTFDWPADGDGLYYYTAALKATQIAQSTLAPKCPGLVTQLVPNDEAWHKKLRDHFHLMEMKIAGAVHSVSWAPKELVIFSVDSQDQDSGMVLCNTKENCIAFNDFTTSRLSNSNDASFPADLCVQSGLDRGSWSLDMRWFIFTAYERGVKDEGLYAIRMSGLNLSRQLSGTEGVQSTVIPHGSIFRLSPGSIQSSLPRMRPFRTRMKIEPRSGQVEMFPMDAILLIGQQ